MTDTTTATSGTAPITKTLELPGAVITYDVRPNESSTRPPLLAIGSPMGASGFPTLASHFTDRTVITYDPRGAERSRLTGGQAANRTEEHADDLHAVIQAVGGGPVDVFASSGGAVNALALVERHPEDVRVLVAHEPPASQVLPDREGLSAAIHDLAETYRRSGHGPGMAKFIALVSHQGELPADYLDRPAPDPSMFGMSSEDDGRRDDPLLGQNVIATTHTVPDIEALKRAPTRIVMAVGTDTDGTMANRAGRAIAEQLGSEPVVFPDGHGGFLGNEYGQPGEPEAFAAKLREVLDS